MKHAYILIVDDDTALLQALPQAVTLRLPGSRVDTSDSAFNALDLIRKNDYDAIVSDIKMPGMDGLALLTNVRELRPDTPMLLITGHGDHNFAVQALRGGAYDFIQKPIDRDYFVAALYRAIQTHQLRRLVTEQQRALETHNQILEQTVLERTRELVKANAAKDEFLSLASHELKTPLSSLKGMTQLLRRRLERAGSSEGLYLSNMENSIRRMEILVNDLLTISFVEMGMFALNCSRCDMGLLCTRLVEEYIIGTNPHPTITVDIPAEPVEADVDVERINQVLINLLSNAYKYSPSNATIHVNLQKIDKNCKISVQDTGTGIAPEAIPHIFERFYRVPNVEVQTGSSVGFGLGLYISQQIIKQHSGHIEVQSVPFQGSVFSIILPLPTQKMETTEQKLMQET